jgi:hypothetical protein
MPVWWGNNGFQWGWVVGLFRGFAAAAAAAACVLPLAARPVGAQQGLTDAQRVRALEQKIWNNNKPALDAKGNPVRGSYECLSASSDLTVRTVTADGTRIKSKEEITVFQRGSYYTLRHSVWAKLNGEKVQIESRPLELFFQKTHNAPKIHLSLSDIGQTPSQIQNRYDQHQAKKPSPDITSIEEAVRIACSNTPSNTPPRTIGPVLQAFAGTQNG